MQHVSNSLPAKSASTQPATQPLQKSLPTSKLATEKEKAALLKDLIKQSFNVFHVFGVQPEAITDKVRAFLAVLDTATSQEISNAFQLWMRERSMMPTPADILALVREEQAYKREMIAARASKPSQEEYRPNGYGRVSWAGKMWGEFTDTDKIGLQNHLEEMEPVKRAEYVKFLKSSAGYPG